MDSFTVFLPNETSADGSDGSNTAPTTATVAAAAVCVQALHAALSVLATSTERWIATTGSAGVGQQQQVRAAAVCSQHRSDVKRLYNVVRATLKALKTDGCGGGDGFNASHYDPIFADFDRQSGGNSARGGEGGETAGADGSDALAGDLAARQEVGMATLLLATSLGCLVFIGVVGGAAFYQICLEKKTDEPSQKASVAPQTSDDDADRTDADGDTAKSTSRAKDGPALEELARRRGGCPERADYIMAKERGRLADVCYTDDGGDDVAAPVSVLSRSKVSLYVPTNPQPQPSRSPGATRLTAMTTPNASIGGE